MRPLTGDALQVAEPSPKATMTMSFDGEVAIELTDAKWTVYPPFARIDEAAQTLKDCEVAMGLLESFAKSGNLPARLMKDRTDEEMELLARLRRR
jgi:hypothetical protein